MSCSCSICRGVPRIDLMFWVSPRPQPTVDELMLQLNVKDTRDALLQLWTLQMKSGIEVMQK